MNNHIIEPWVVIRQVVIGGHGQHVFDALFVGLIEGVELPVTLVDHHTMVGPVHLGEG